MPDRSAVLTISDGLTETSSRLFMTSQRPAGVSAVISQVIEIIKGLIKGENITIGTEFILQNGHGFGSKTVFIVHHNKVLV